MRNTKSACEVRSWAERLRQLFMGKAAPTSGSRRAFLKRTSLGLTAAPAVALLGRPARVRANFEIDREDLRVVFAQIQAHENNHVEELMSVLGSEARPEPTFQNLTMPDLDTFVKTSQVLENTGTGAYLGAAEYIYNPGYVSLASSIALIEARHASFLNGVRDYPITGDLQNLNQDWSFEQSLDVADVQEATSNFIANLNGGPPISYSTTPSAQNDIAIFNFALALEYLEASFYNINVPKFFKRDS